MDYKDYYGILGISRDADGEEVKRAYRKMARTYHPDVNPDKATATERFKDINEAYTVLSDADKRRRYDQINSSYEQMRRTSARASSTASQGRSGASSNYSYTSSSSYSSSAAGASAKRPAEAAGSRSDTRGAANGGARRTYTGTISEEDMERIFRGFGWAYSAARGQRTTSSGGADFSDFFDALFGGLRGRPDEDSDSTEFRPGRDLQVDATLTLEEAFSGAYRVVSLSDGRKVEISIPAGVSTGSKLRVRDQGVRSFGRPRGHLYVNINVKPHPQFTREGDDLRVKVTVPHQVAAKSGEIKVPALDRTVVLKIPAGARSGQVMRLRGLGMPRLTPDKLRGDLLVELTVQPAPPPKAGKPRPAAGHSTKAGARIGVWLRKLLGLTLMAVALTAFVAVVLNSGAAGWQLAAVFGAILLAHGLATRSWIAAPGAVATGAGLGYAIWSGGEVGEVVPYALPLLPLALGYYLLAYRRAR